MSTATSSISGLGPLGPLVDKIGDAWWALLALGTGWVVIGAVVLRFDSATPRVVSVVLGIALLLCAVGEVVRALVTSSGWMVVHLLFAALLVVSAILAFSNPDGSFTALVISAGFYFIFVGTFDIISSLFAAGTVPGWWLQLVSGILEIVLGVMASTSLTASLVLFVTWFGLTAVLRGVSEIGLSFTIRSLRSA